MSVPALVDEPADDVLPELAGFLRPRLRDDVPVMWRSESTIQIGEDVVIDRVSRSHVAWLSSLDGLHSPAMIAESLTIPDQDAARLVRALLAAGALDDAARIPEPMRWLPQPARDTAAGRFGAALQTHRSLERAYAAVAARDACRIVVVGEGAVADELRSSVESAGLRVVTDHATFTLLADAPHPDVPARFDDPAQDLPHLHVGVLGARAVVGPLVVPGVTSCLRCAHLHRRDADPAWPLLSVQWAQAVPAMAVPPRDPLLTRLAAAHAAQLVSAWADLPDEPGSWSGYALEISLPLGMTTRRERPPHPLCGCSWAAP